MTELFKKLNYKNQETILVVNPPESFEVELDVISERTGIIRNLNQTGAIEFALIFLTKQAEIDTIIPEIMPKLRGDALLWMCYPKGTSKKYTCDFNRDTGWDILRNSGLESVRMVAIDSDWSALRFRKTEYIKK
ncbi:hypothetical protein SAMN04515674_10466 [Pseudarcicella hirudinis]|uniref:DUF3052 domain-containing protein n=1 Tax=Pseudarcicella hirudinis TaxID=1079859 RepID=A0A1I5RGF8_9BACT|nr:hypothetical protein [Pseudarcicella hirudinis]SFP57638.1 hypothetical protein SAMN04515674_10466 [Pseudarcicella hirudinis]